MIFVFKMERGFRYLLAKWLFESRRSCAVAMTLPLEGSIVPQSRSSYDRATNKHYCATVAQ